MRITAEGLTSFVAGLLYEQQLRPYSLAGDNCQQFILQFCREIGVEFDHDAMGRLKTATGLIQAIRLCLFLLAALFVVDLSVNKGRLILATPITPAIGLSTLSFVTLAHPRMFLSSFSSLPPTFAHILYCLHSGVVWLLWVVFGVWTAFSVETGCDDKGFSMVNGEKISYFWNPCNVALRLFQLALFVIALAGALYHDFYTFYFVKGR